MDMSRKRKLLRFMAVILVFVFLWGGLPLTAQESNADDTVNDEVYSETGTGAGSEAGNEAGNETESDTGNGTGDETGDETGNDTGSETGNDTGSGTGIETGVTQTDAEQEDEAELSSEEAEKVQPQITISGFVVDCQTKLGFPDVTITVENNGNVLATTKTGEDGSYTISFTSNDTIFKVIASALGHIPSTKEVTVNSNPSDPTDSNLYGTADFELGESKMLKPVKMVMLFGAAHSTAATTKLVSDIYYKELVSAGYDFQLKIFRPDLYIGREEEYTKMLSEELETTNILCIYEGGTGSPGLISAVVQAVRQLPADAKIFGDATWRGILTDRNVTLIPSGFGSSRLFGPDFSRDNVKRFFLWVLQQSGAINISSDETTPIPQNRSFIYYHPDTSTEFPTIDSYLQWYTDSGRYKANAPWIGILIRPWHYISNDMKMNNALISTVEARGANVITIIGSTTDGYDMAKNMAQNGTPIDVLIWCNSHGNVTLSKELNVPIIMPLWLQSELLEDYLKYSTGLPGRELMTMVSGELQGFIIPILIGGPKDLGTDPSTGAPLLENEPYQPGIEQLADQAIARANLRHKANSDKKIALVYVDSPHDENIPVAAGLNLPASIANILRALAQNGYNLGDIDVNALTADRVLEWIRERGRNPINPTQQDLLELIQKGAITIPVSEYIEWFNKLPESLRQQVIEQWGEPPGNVMVHGDKIVIPGMFLDKIFLGVQPRWIWDGTLDNLYNNTLPPTHQYIAFYLWLQNGFNADAVVHIGAHGTVELLPGRSSGMTADDWPNTLIGRMPNIYIYRVGGEANPAKRRAYAVMISHLIPPVTNVELYGNYQALKDLIKSYKDAENYNDTERMNLLKQQIWDTIKNETGLSERLVITESTDFKIVLSKLTDYLEELEKSLTTCGLHTFGELPDDETLEKFIDAIISFDPKNRSGMRDQIRDLLLQSAANEIRSLLNALSGGYVESGIDNDPIRSLDALPTGRNLYSFDPRRVPDAAAMTIGSKAAEEMLKRYKEANDGKYPETVAVDVMGSEVVRTMGQSIASIFYLLGVKPVYSAGVVVGTEVIPLEQLGRPRIDVLVTASVSFINVCPYTLEILDNAIRQVALLDEPTTDNYVRKHYLAMWSELTTELESQGLSGEEASKQAERLARARIFGLPPGADPHGVGAGRLLRYSDSWTEEELAETYLNYNSYLHGSDITGVPGRSVMEKLLGTVDATMSIKYTATPGHRYGGSALVNFMVRYLTGRNIESYIVETAYGSPRVMTMQESVYDDLAKTLLNPQWREAMVKEGYSGHATIALRIRGLFTTDALVNVVSSDVWNKIANTYFFDESVYNQLDPMARQVLSHFLYQANRRGFMQLNSEQAKKLAEMMGLSAPTTTPTSPAAPTPVTPQADSDTAQTESGMTGADTVPDLTPSDLTDTASSAPPVGESSLTIPPAAVPRVSQAGQAPAVPANLSRPEVNRAEVSNSSPPMTETVPPQKEQARASSEGPGGKTRAYEIDREGGKGGAASALAYAVSGLVLLALLGSALMSYFRRV